MIAVIFTSQRTTYNKGYEEFNEQLDKLAREQKGFIKQESTRQENGFGISISYWENEESAKAFKKLPIHIEAQQKGKSIYYQWYDVKICEVNRHYSYN